MREEVNVAPVALTLNSIEYIPLSLYAPGGLALTVWFGGCRGDCPWCPWGADAPPQTLRRLRLSRDMLLDLVRRNSPDLLFFHGADSYVLNWLLSMARDVSSLVPVGFKVAAPRIDTAIELLKPFAAVMLVELTSNDDPGLLNTLQGYLQGTSMHIEAVMVLPPKEELIREMLTSVRDVCRGLSTPIPINIVPPGNVNELALLSYMDSIRKAGCINTVVAGSRISELSTVFCPHCKRPVVIRHGYWVIDLKLDEHGRCKYCGAKVVSRMPRIRRKTAINVPIM